MLPCRVTRRTALLALLVVQNPLLGAKHIGFLQTNFEGIVFATIDIDFLVAKIFAHNFKGRMIR